MIIQETIYTFIKGKVLYGVASVDDVVFGQGFKLIKDKRSKLNTPYHILKRARKSVVAMISNSLNAYLMFGKNVFENGEVSVDKFKEEEMKTAWKLSRKGEEYDKNIKEFKIKEITLKEAKENGLI